MFRKRRSSEKKGAVVPATEAEAGAGVLWYKKPTERPSSQQNSPAPASPYHPPGTWNPSNVQSPPPNNLKPPPVYSNFSPRTVAYDSPASVQRKTDPTLSRGNTHVGNQNRQPIIHPITTADLVQSILRGNDWGRVKQMIDRDPKCVRNKLTMKLLGHTTVAYPFHACVVMNAPIQVVEIVLSINPESIQKADETNGMMPLHWACLSGASPSILQLLTERHGPATKVQDKINGRLPLHYIVMHASELNQVIVILDAEPRGVKTKDKQSRTPKDLAYAMTGPLKLDILAELQKKRQTPKKKRTSRGDSDKIVANGYGILGGALGHAKNPPEHQEVAKAPNSGGLLGLLRRNHQEPKPEESHTNIVLREPVPESAPPRDAQSVGSSPSRFPQHMAYNATLGSSFKSDPMSRTDVSYFDHGRQVVPPYPPRPSNGVTGSPRRNRGGPGTMPATTREYQTPNNHFDSMQVYTSKVEHLTGEAKSIVSAGNHLVDGMHAEMGNLQRNVTTCRNELQQKEDELAGANHQLLEVQLAHDTACKAFEKKRRAHQEQENLLFQKNDKISRLRQQLNDLQERLSREEDEAKVIHQTMIQTNDSMQTAEVELQKHKDQQQQLTLLCQTLEDQRNDLSRAFHNQSSELKSLEAIQNLALQNDDYT